MHFMLIYDVGPDFIQRRSQFRDEHLTLAWKELRPVSCFWQVH
jgi:hypothetical protein